MEIVHGLISCDSHVQVNRDAWERRMSKEKWGDRIPRVIEVEDKGELVERWVVDGKVQGGGVVNCPGAMPDHQTYPRRWEEVPLKVYDPLERLEALDTDGVDAEVLYPNTPVQSFTFWQGGEDWELACVQAYNDAVAEWRQVSDRYVPLALIPYLSPIETIVAETERAVRAGHGGIVMLTEPSLTIPGVKHTNDPWWEPLWAACQALDVPMHWHGSGGLVNAFSVPRWDGYNTRQAHTASTSRLCTTPCQMIPNLLLSGRLEHYPRLKWACGETGMGWMNFVLESCDHEWERRRLWTEGLTSRPSDIFRRQIYVDFWFERGGVETRHQIGIDNIMWESDYPHITSTYPDSRAWVERVVGHLPDDERQKMLWENAARLYKLGHQPSALSSQWNG